MVNGEQKVKKKKVVKVQHLTLTSMKPSQPSKQLYATRYNRKLVCVVYCKTVKTNKSLKSMHLSWQVNTTDFKMQETDVFLLLYFLFLPSLIHQVKKEFCMHGKEKNLKNHHSIFG